MKKISLVSGLAALGTVLAGFLWVGAAAGADTIFFKDGMRTLCQGKAWEEKDEVHCEHDGGLLIYPKNDVARIEKDPSSKAGSDSVKGQDAGIKPTPLPAPPPPAPLPKAEPPPSAQTPSGVLFYDPRRDQKYWSSPTVRHDSYQEALSALAAEFERPCRGSRKTWETATTSAKSEEPWRLANRRHPRHPRALRIIPRPVVSNFTTPAALRNIGPPRTLATIRMRKPLRLWHVNSGNPRPGSSAIWEMRTISV
jgi:hypothetical protein